MGGLTLGPRPLAINYLLEDTTLFGGVKVVLHHANLLCARGHRVTVVSKGPQPGWYPVQAPFLQVPEFSYATVPEADVTVATYWTTVEPAFAAGRGQVVHYCQGFEASLTHNAADHPHILSAYRVPIPAFAVAPHLVVFLAARFGRAARLVPPALERYWRPRPRLAPRPPFRVLVMHPVEFYPKGTGIALAAVQQLRQQGVPCRLVRVTQLPVSDVERRELRAEDLHVGLAPRRVARVMRRCDLLLAPSWAVEGFGLPVLEAAASGVPPIASDIPAFRDLLGDWPALVRFDDTSAFAAAAGRLLTDRVAWRQLRDRGLEAAHRFSVKRSAEVLEEAMRWVADGSWRRDRGAAGALRDPGEARA